MGKRPAPSEEWVEGESGPERAPRVLAWCARRAPAPCAQRLPARPCVAAASSPLKVFLL